MGILIISDSHTFFCNLQLFSPTTEKMVKAAEDTEDEPESRVVKMEETRILLHYLYKPDSSDAWIDREPGITTSLLPLKLQPSNTTSPRRLDLTQMPSGRFALSFSPPGLDPLAARFNLLQGLDE